MRGCCGRRPSEAVVASQARVGTVRRCLVARSRAGRRLAWSPPGDQAPSRGTETSRDWASVVPPPPPHTHTGIVELSVVRMCVYVCVCMCVCVCRHHGSADPTSARGARTRHVCRLGGGAWANPEGGGEAGTSAWRAPSILVHVSVCFMGHNLVYAGGSERLEDAAHTHTHLHVHLRALQGNGRKSSAIPMLVIANVALPRCHNEQLAAA